MRFLENTDLLKIEDILPFFPDFVVIDDFKEEICTALEGYSAHIDALKADIMHWAAIYVRAVSSLPSAGDAKTNPLFSHFRAPAPWPYP